MKNLSFPDIFEKGMHYVFGELEVGYVGRDSDAKHIFVRIFQGGNNLHRDEYSIIAIKPGTFITDGRGFIAMEDNVVIEEERLLNATEEKHYHDALQNRVKKMVNAYQKK